MDIYIDPQIYEELEKLSEQWGLSKSRIVEFAIRKLLAERGQRNDVF